MQIDVEQMAWNTGLRCRRMGDDGKGLEVIAKEIRVFANNLEAVSAKITGTFEQLSAAAGSMRERSDEGAGAGADAGRALSESLPRSAPAASAWRRAWRASTAMPPP